MKLSTLFVLALAAFVGNCLVAGSSFNDRIVAQFGTQSNNLAFSIEDLTSATTISDAEFDFAVPDDLVVVGYGDTKSSARAGRIDDGGEVATTLASSEADGSFGAGDFKALLKSNSKFGGNAQGTNKVGQGVQESFADGESTWFGEFGEGFGEAFATTAEAETADEAVAGGGVVSGMNFNTFFNGLGGLIPDGDDDETSSNVGESAGDAVCAPGSCTAQADTTSYQVGNVGQCGTVITQELLDGPHPPAACQTCECGKCYEVCTDLDCQIVVVVDLTGTATFEIAGTGPPPPGPPTGSPAWGKLCPKCNSENTCVAEDGLDPRFPGAYCSAQKVTQREVPCPT